MSCARLFIIQHLSFSIYGKVSAHTEGKQNDQNERDKETEPPIREERRLLLHAYPERRGDGFFRGEIRASRPELGKCPVETGLGEGRMELNIAILVGARREEQATKK